MKVSQQRHDVGLMAKAKARMREIDTLLANPEQEDREALTAERADLVDSWIIREEIDLPDVITEEEGIARDLELAKEEQRQAIRAELGANDLKIIRAVIEGDSKRIAEHNAAQEALREKLRAI